MHTENETFKFQEDDDYENEISSMLSQRYFGGKRDSRLHSTASFSDSDVNNSDRERA